MEIMQNRVDLPKDYLQWRNAWKNWVGLLPFEASKPKPGSLGLGPGAPACAAKSACTPSSQTSANRSPRNRTATRRFLAVPGGVFGQRTEGCAEHRLRSGVTWPWETQVVPPVNGTQSPLYWTKNGWCTYPKMGSHGF